ncbi:terminase family protein [Thermogutta sp.]|uniref:phage terminase large subunit family protein n=1 Tax=Thermogutta sp. TaxID=1962930 RepID=UPI0032204DA1
MKIQRKLHSGQARAWRSDARFVFIIAGTGGGKTYFGPLWLHREIERHPEGSFLVIAPTYGILQRVVYPELKKLVDTFYPGALYKAIERTCYLPTGGRIFFGSADRPLTLEGAHCRAVWMDEAGQMRREAWDVALRRVGFHKGRVLGTTTPYNLGWLKVEVYDRWKAGDKDYEVVQFPSVLNPAYPREEFERARQTLPGWKFKMFYLGQFTRPQGLVYQDFDPAEHIVEPFEIPKDWRRVAGIDLGYNNPTAVVWLAFSNDDVAYAYREYYQRNRLPGEIAREVAEAEAVDAAYCDPSSPEAIEELRRAGVPAMPAENAVKPGIESVISRLRSRRLFVFRGLYNLLDEIENYRWKEQNEQLKDEPVKEYDHAVDALRYAIASTDKDVRIELW